MKIILVMGSVHSNGAVTETGVKLFRKQQRVSGAGGICWQHTRDLNEDITQDHIELPLSFIILKQTSFKVKRDIKISHGYI